MKRRTFILGSGALGTISLSLTASSASFADSISAESNFQVIDSGVQSSLRADPPTENEVATHIWEFDGILIDSDVLEITLGYPTGTRFDGVTTDDITVEFLQSDGKFKEIKLATNSYSGSTATIIVDNGSTISGEAIVTIDGIENPDPGSYTPEITFSTSNNEYTTDAGLGISADSAFFAVDITDAPDAVSSTETITASYTVTNTGQGTGSQTVSLLVDGTQEATTDVTLAEGESFDGEFSYRTTDNDVPEVDIDVSSTNTSDSRTVGIGGEWALDLAPTKQRQDSIHTWSTAFVDFTGEVDEITVVYPDRMNFGGLTETGVTVEITRDGESSPTTIGLVSDTYSGPSATYNLDDSYDTDIDGEVIVTVDDITNPKKGTYSAEIVLNGGDDSASFGVDFDVG
jgi:hypothetical protein